MYSMRLEGSKRQEDGQRVNCRMSSWYSIACCLAFDIERNRLQPMGTRRSSHGIRRFDHERSNSHHLRSRKGFV